MREYEMEVLEKYELEVNSTRRIRGAFYCDTKEGTMLLKETKISERRVPLLYLILNRDEVAERVSKSRTAVTNSMRLLKLSERVQQMIVDDMISTGHARALLALDDEEQQYILANKIFDEKMVSGGRVQSEERGRYFPGSKKTGRASSGISVV